MLICDTHADTLWARSAGNASPDVTLANLTACKEDIRIQALALYVHTGGMEEKPNVVERELNTFAQMKAEGFHQIREVSEAQPGLANVMLTIEGGEAFGSDPANVEHFAQLGVRMAALTWNNENLIAHPALSGSREGLTPFGRDVVRRMHHCRMAADVSHLNERGFWDLMDGPVCPMASHSCARRLCDHPRNLNDDQLRALFAAGGFVGVNFYPTFLSEDSRADIDRIIDHMAYMCDLGGEDCVGLGSDFDGIELYPEGMRTAADVPRLIDRLRERGFGSATEKIAGLNFKRYMENL